MGLKGLALTGTYPPGNFIPVIDGNPIPVPYRFTVGITDAYGATALVSSVIRVFPHVAFTVSGVNCVGYGCSVDLPYTLGTPSGTVDPFVTDITCADPPCNGTGGEPAANTLPAGFSVSVDTSNQVVTVSFPSPGGGANWFGTISVTITDQSLCAPGGTHCAAAQTVTVDSNTSYG
jgi:hypothetical protein